MRWCLPLISPKVYPRQFRKLSLAVRIVPSNENSMTACALLTAFSLPSNSALRFLSAVDPGRALAVDAPRLRLVLVDLQPGMTGLPALVEQFQTTRKIPVVAFGSHVATALLDEARQAGCHEVLPRSRLHAGLDELLRHYALEC